MAADDCLVTAPSPQPLSREGRGAPECAPSPQPLSREGRGASGSPLPLRERAARSAGEGGGDLDALCRFCATNRFMPVPPAGRAFVGDGDFRAIGAEFLGHFVRLGGLAPTEAVLEIGCGIGRMALPLTQYLQPPGRYVGVDVVADGIGWCTETITPVYPAFTFEHLDLRHDLYNPGGRMETGAVALPFLAAAFDLILLTSVFTHLRQAEVEAYVPEIGRLLRPGGRCFLSLFAVDDAARQGLRTGRSRPPFDPDAVGPEFISDPDHPTAAVAYDPAYLVGLFAAAGLALACPPVPGHWSGRDDVRPDAAGGSYQDLFVFTRRRREGETP